VLLIGHGNSIPHHLDRSKLRKLPVILLSGQFGFTRHGDYTLMSSIMRCLSGDICLIIGALPLKRRAHASR
jgi:hypothetical protein